MIDMTQQTVLWSISKEFFVGGGLKAKAEAEMEH